MSDQQATVVISYSHDDEDWKEFVARHLNVAAMQGRLRLWEDRQIGAGDDWERDIESEFGQAAVAILLVSSFSLTSDFILRREVAMMLRRRETEGLKVIPIVVGDCAWKAVGWLQKMNLRPKDGKALESFSEAERNSVMAAITLEILDHLKAANELDENSDPPAERPEDATEQPSVDKAQQPIARAPDAVSRRRLSDEERRQIFLLHLESLISESIDAVDALNMGLGTSFSADKAGVSDLSEKLLDLRVDDAITFLQDAYWHLKRQARTQGASVLCRITRLVLPAVFDPALFKKIEACKGDINAALVPLGTATRTVAELVMAGVDGRPASHHSPSENSEWPGGEFELPIPPEVGRQSFGSRFVASFHQHLVNQFTDRDHRTRFAEDVLRKRVASSLKVSADHGRTYYYVFSLPESEATNPELNEIVRRLRTSYPSIVFIRLSNDPDLYLNETEMFESLREHFGPASG